MGWLWGDSVTAKGSDTSDVSESSGIIHKLLSKRLTCYGLLTKQSELVEASEIRVLTATLM